MKKKTSLSVSASGAFYPIYFDKEEKARKKRMDKILSCLKGLSVSEAKSELDNAYQEILDRCKIQ